MVLDQAVSPPPENYPSTSSNLPSSTDSWQESPAPNRTGLTPEISNFTPEALAQYQASIYDPSSLSKPFPFVGPLFGYTSSYLRRRCITSAVYLNKELPSGRLLTREESQAIHEATSRGVRLASWGSPLGVLAGYYRWYKTQDTMRMPFFKAPDKEILEQKDAEGNPRPKPERGWRRFIWDVAERDPAALRVWNRIRFITYLSVGWIVVSFFFRANGVTIAAMGYKTDSRLQGANEELQEKFMAMREASGSNRPAPPRRSARDESRMMKEVDQGAAWGQAGGSESQPMQDSMGASGYYADNMQSSPYAPREPSQREPPKRELTYAELQSQPSDSFDFSGVDGGGKKSTGQRETSQNDSGSAWDRLRQQNAQQQGQESGWARVRRENSGGSTEK